MSTVEQHRSVSALAQRARTGISRRTVLATVAFGVLVATVAGLGTVTAVRERDAALVGVDHRVMATVSPGVVHSGAGARVRTAVATWPYPAGVTHRASQTVSIATRTHQELIWVDSAGARVQGPAGRAGLFGAVVMTVLRVALLSGLALAVVAMVVPVRRRLRLRRTVDRRWNDIVHQLLEEL